MVSDSDRLAAYKLAGGTGDLPVGFDVKGDMPTSGGQVQATNPLAQQATDTAAMNAAQEAKINNFITSYQSAVNALPTVQQSATDIGATLGLPNLQKNAQTLTAQVASIPQVQTNATRGYNVNSNQLSQIISSKLGQLQPQAQQAVTQEQNAEGNLATELGYQQQQNAQSLQPLQLQGTMLSSQIAAEMTGFNQDKQNQLSAYLDAMDNNEKLTAQQLSDANALAAAKIQYDSVAQKVQNQVVGAGSSLYSPTGQLLATAPSSSSSTSDTSNTANYFNNAPQYSAPKGTISGNYYSTGSGWIPVTS